MFGRFDLKKRYEAGETLIGTWVTLASADVAEIAADAGFDFVCIDMEHGSFGMDRLVDIMRGVEIGGAATIVRLPDTSRSTIQKVLDAGASGILAPNLSTEAKALQLVSNSRYAPLGTRGACPRIRATRHQTRDWIRDFQEANDNILVWGLLETTEGIDNLDAILTVRGLDGIVTGPFDLAQDLNMPNGHDSEQVSAIFSAAREKILQSDKALVEVLFGFDEASVKNAYSRLADQGVRIFVCGTDRRILASGYRSIPSWFGR
ncbi:aldolase/citrate lyase family protein [Chelativorans sp. Marseille-P2723]|uniref:HpcH/HpaI aldolase family protein n=1 Tax=Chelativorans sp. Marseille-P2723 TaxID=2709133 RepID=UPI0015715682|nr:aldolase/citrate lyase family protein [Chelativorans sp. Marseille-P2723]